MHVVILKSVCGYDYDDCYENIVMVAADFPTVYKFVKNKVKDFNENLDSWESKKLIGFDYFYYRVEEHKLKRI